MAYYGYDDIATRVHKGYTYWLVSDPTTGNSIDPGYAAVSTAADFDAALQTLGDHSLAVLDDLRAQSGRRIAEVTVGKTYVKRNKAKAHFDSLDGDTWAIEGVRNRWNNRYKQPNWDCDGLIVITCFERSDVPAALAAHRIDHQDLCLKYEECLSSWLKRNMGKHRGRIRDGDTGGGGRRSKTHAGFVLYLAFRFQ